MGTKSKRDWVACLALAAGMSGALAQVQPPQVLAGGVALQMASSPSLAQIRALPPTALVQLKSGKVVQARQVQAMAEALQGMSARPVQGPLDLALRRQTGPADVVLGSAGRTLGEVRRMPPATVVQLADGTRVSVADIAKVEEFARRTNLQARMGLAAPAAAAPPAAKVRTMADVMNLRLPDSAIVEAPNGARARLGELKALVAQRQSERTRGVRP
ncbi:MAG: hypothetical protein QM569_07405 [Acidovorax sp.]|uniref:hypothetical protein n=1 Tax=Acidovorax sp. TaxID=1872122 RepID=UPI0039E3B485